MNSHGEGAPSPCLGLAVSPGKEPAAEVAREGGLRLQRQGALRLGIEWHLRRGGLCWRKWESESLEPGSAVWGNLKGKLGLEAWAHRGWREVTGCEMEGGCYLRSTPAVLHHSLRRLDPGHYIVLP